MKKLLVIAFSVIVGIFFATSANAQYTIEDLGILGLDEYEHTIAYGINELGQIVGSSGNSDGIKRAFVWENSVMTDLGALEFDGWSIATGINEAGDVVGLGSMYGEVLYSHHAFRGNVSGGPLTDMGIDTFFSEAQGINDLGRAVGNEMTEEGDDFPVYWDPDNVLEQLPLLTAEEGSWGKAYAVNNKNEIVGQCTGLDEESLVATLWKEGSPYSVTSLGYLSPDDQSSMAVDVNEISQAVGFSGAKKGATEAVLWDFSDPDNISALGLGWLMPDGFFSQAMGLNDDAFVVGASVVPIGPGLDDFEEHAFLWNSASGMVDLNDYVPDDFGWTLFRGIDITNNGQIIVQGEKFLWDEETGYNRRVEHAFLLSPLSGNPGVVPEPATLLLFGTGIFGAFVGRRRK